MRALTPFVAAILLAGCAQEGSARPPLQDQFYFPAGLVLAHPAGSTNGVLYVANGDFDKRYTDGTVMAVDLDKVGAPGATLPSFGAPVPQSGPVQVTALNLTPQQIALISPFAGEMASFPVGGALRLFVPSRSENNKLQVIDANGSTLSCGSYQGSGTPVDCATHAPSLAAHANAEDPTGKPAAVSPYGVGLSSDGQLFVTALASADSPFGSGTLLENFAVVTSAATPTINDQSFLSLGVGGANSVAVGQRYAYVTGRYLAVGNSDRDVLVRLVDRQIPGAVGFPQLEPIYHVLETRGVALNAGETRMYLVGRAPDSLAVVNLTGAATGSPKLSVAHSVPLPNAPDEIRLIERPGRGPLAVITCSGADSVAIYDDDVGAVVKQIENVGTQPFAIAVDPIGSGARVFVSNFGDGRVAVIDIPDLNRAQDARVVAHLSKQQTCIVRADDPSCQGTQL